MDLVVEGRTLTADGPRRIRLGVERGVFVDAGGARADVSFDRGFILPAAIDIHCHFRDPGLTHKEDLTSGTTSAAFGGVSLACDMPNTEPATTTIAAYEAKVELVERKAVVDVGLWAGVTPALDALALGDRATGYKLYAGPTTGALLVEKAADWQTAARHIAGTGRPMAVHAEDPRLLAEARAREKAPDDPASHARSRPGDAELAVLQALAREPGARRVHACHLSDPRSAPLAREAGFTSEVCPHHLLLASPDVARLGAYAKVNPPIRGPRERDGLWQAFTRGVIDCIASDHAPHTGQEKDAGFDKAPSGLPGVETAYPLMLAKAFEGVVPLARVLQACCEKPAQVIDVPAGRLEPGQWASLVHVPEEPRAIRAEDLHSKCGWTPFEGMSGLFPDALLVRGRWVVRDGLLVAKPGEGRFVGGPGSR